jgi:CBS domain-containing protein
MKAQDIMTKDVVSVKPEAKVTEVAKILYQKNFNGLPVIDNSGEVLGLITQADLLTRDSFGTHIPSLIKMLVDFQAIKTLEGEEKKELENILSFDARSVMNANYVSVFPQISVEELTEIFNERRVNPILVIDENKKLKGIVSRSDIMKLIGRIGEAEFEFSD